MKKIALIPYVCGAGASTEGCEQGPSDLKNNGLEKALVDKGLDVSWFEDPEVVYAGEYGKSAHENLPPLGSEERNNLVMWHCKHMRDKVCEAIDKGMQPVTIGGDHSMAAASISGLAKAKKAHGRIGVIWVDAHPDINTWNTTPSESLHGMPVAAMLGLGVEEMEILAGDKTAINPEHIVYIGIRDIDPGEWDSINDLNINHFTMEAVKKLGVAEVFRQALVLLDGKVDHIALSLDLDGLDPQDVASIGTPVEDGIRLAELLPVLQDVASQKQFDLIEITEYNPTLGGQELTRGVILSLLDALFAGQEAKNANVA